MNYDSSVMSPFLSWMEEIMDVQTMNPSFPSTSTKANGIVKAVQVVPVPRRTLPFHRTLDGGTLPPLIKRNDELPILPALVHERHLFAKADATNAGIARGWVIGLPKSGRNGKRVRGILQIAIGGCTLHGRD
jgi:hypothetical protein